MSVDVSGTWMNQNGSLVELIEEDGRVSGWYESRKGRAVSGKRYAVSGQRNGEVIAFQVNWQDDAINVHSITSFSGRLVRDANGEAIHTVWVLARQFEDEAQSKPTAAWNAFLTNSDLFRRVEE